MMVHQDGSRHQRVPGCLWDLIVTMDDATGEHLSMFFVEEEGTASSFQGVQEGIERYGLFGSLYTDRGSHYWLTEQAGGKVAPERPTQFGRAMRQLGIGIVPLKYVTCPSRRAKASIEVMRVTPSGKNGNCIYRTGTLDSRPTLTTMPQYGLAAKSEPPTIGFRSPPAQTFSTLEL